MDGTYIYLPTVQPNSGVKHHVRSRSLTSGKVEKRSAYTQEGRKAKSQRSGVGTIRLEQACGVCVSLQIRDYTFKKYYLDEYLEGQSELQRGLASTAIQEAMNGNTPILLHLLKTKLGWSEQQVIEHIGEVKAVVSAKPLTKDEFVQKYLTEDEET